MNILLLHGPNLNLLGEREPEIYGHATLEEIENELLAVCIDHGDILKSFQSNHEGHLIDMLHEERKWLDGLVFNPGALTHYSYALRDAVSGIDKPMVEVHLTDLNKREEFRRFSVFQDLPNVRQVMGSGVAGYHKALAMLRKLKQ